MMKESYRHLLKFLSELEERGVAYTLGHFRKEALMISIAVPGERWEIEFLDDGSVEVERFVSTGRIEHEEVFSELFDPRLAELGRD